MTDATPLAGEDRPCAAWARDMDYAAGVLVESPGAVRDAKGNVVEWRPFKFVVEVVPRVEEDVL